MKKIICFLLLAAPFLFFSSCKSAKQPTGSSDTSKLSGTWELNYISGRRIAFEGLYPENKPQISFNLQTNELSGNTTCNPFTCKMTIDDSKISIAEPMAMTMRVCEGEGERAFLDMLKKVNSYSLNNDTLSFVMDQIPVMRFAKK